MNLRIDLRPQETHLHAFPGENYYPCVGGQKSRPSASHSGAEAQEKHKLHQAAGTNRSRFGTPHTTLAAASCELTHTHHAVARECSPGPLHAPARVAARAGVQEKQRLFNSCCCICAQRRISTVSTLAVRTQASCNSHNKHVAQPAARSPPALGLVRRQISLLARLERPISRYCTRLQLLRHGTNAGGFGRSSGTWPGEAAHRCELSFSHK